MMGLTARAILENLDRGQYLEQEGVDTALQALSTLIVEEVINPDEPVNVMVAMERAGATERLQKVMG